MDSKEKTAFIFLLNKDDGIILIFAQNLWTASCLAVTQSDRKPRSPESNESLNFEFLNL